MKRLLLFIFCLLGFNLYSQSIYWEQIGLTGITIYDLDYVSSSGKLYAITGTNIYLSTDKGRNWNSISNLGGRSFAIDNEGVLYLQWLGYVRKSTDNGATWTDIHNNSGAYEFHSVKVLPNNNLMIGTLSGMKYSTNKGLTWNSTNYPGAFSGPLVISKGNLYTDPGGMSGSLSGGIIMKSIDTGKTWTFLPNGYSNIGSICSIYDSILLGRYYSTPNKGIHISYDQGLTWQFWAHYEYSQSIGATFYVDGRNNLFIVNSIPLNEILFSSDTGKTITYANLSTGVSKLINDENNSVYIGTGNGVYRTNYFATPVELISFNAVVTDEIELNWSTASETNNKGFEVQKSYDNSNFISIGFVNGAGTSSENKSYSFVDKSLKPGTYFYRLKQIDFDGSYKYHKTITVNYIDKNIPDEFILYQNYPNPFNPSTKIKYFINQDAQVELKLLTPMGEENLLEKGLKSAGEYEYIFDGSKLSSGIYFMKVIVGNESKIIKMILMK